MNPLDNTIEYRELIMTLDDLTLTKDYPLPNGFCIEFCKGNGDVENWVDIHIKSGEFQSEEKALELYHVYYDSFIDEVPQRCFFIVNPQGAKIATSTISPSEEYGYHCAVDWLAISSQYQGKGLGRALIAQTIKLARTLGYDKLLLHTQTTTWLAAKLYLDFGFKPFVSDGARGWEILKTITNHPSLKNFNALQKDEIYSPLMLNVKSQLLKIHKDFTFEVWYKNNRNDVYVRSDGKFFAYKFFDEGLRLEKA